MGSLCQFYINQARSWAESHTATARVVLCRALNSSLLLLLSLLLSSGFPKNLPQASFITSSSNPLFHWSPVAGVIMDEGEDAFSNPDCSF